MGLFSKKSTARPTLPPEPKYALVDPGLQDGDLRQVTYTFTTSFGLTHIVAGPVDPVTLFDEVCRVAPAFADSSYGGPGIGLIAGSQTLPWTVVTGTEGSALHFFGHPDADAHWITERVGFPLMREIVAPCFTAVVTMDAVAERATASIVNAASRGVPAWQIPRLGLSAPSSSAERVPVPDGIAQFLLDSGWSEMDGGWFKGTVGLENGRTQVALVMPRLDDELGLLSPFCAAPSDEVPAIVDQSAPYSYPHLVVAELVMLEDRLPIADAADQGRLVERIVALAGAADVLEQRFGIGDEL